VTDTTVFQLSQPGPFADPLTEVLRNGARALLTQAVEAEVAAFLGCHADKLTDDGRQRLVRHGHLPEREIVTGIGPVAVRCPRVRDRAGEGPERIRFSSAILPPYARRSKSLEVLIPVLYLKGISTGDFDEALIALLGKDAGGLSASTIGRLKDARSEEHVHMIVPGGGLARDGSRWIACKPNFLLPVRVLSKLFRRLMLEKLVAAHETGQLRFFTTHAHLADAKAFAAFLAPLRKKRWFVYAKRPFAGPKAVLAYL
jgi:Putative transposase/Transposase, Mutator family